MGRQQAYLHHWREPPISFWRDQTGHEVDLLVEEGGELYPVEIKSGQTVSQDLSGPLSWWSTVAGQSTGASTLVYGGAEAYTRSGVSVRPWFSV